MSDSMKQIAMRIEDLRESADYTVEQMAEMLNITADEYRRYETGRADMSISLLVKISELFHVDMTELLTGQAPRLNTLSVTRAGQGKLIDCHDQYV